MRKISLIALLATFTALSPLAAQEAEKPEYPSPNAIVEAAPASDWVTIAPGDLLVMDLAPDAEGNPRRVIIQLMPEPFSQGWIRNIRKLAQAHWWDGTSINRVQDNYVVQWGDAGYDNPESGETEQKALPEGLETVPESEYSTQTLPNFPHFPLNPDKLSDKQVSLVINAMILAGIDLENFDLDQEKKKKDFPNSLRAQLSDRYSDVPSIIAGWPVAAETDEKTLIPKFWPVHCYGAVGVGRNYSPDTGSGAELYTVIGHAPRHLDRNIAVVGRIRRRNLRQICRCPGQSPRSVFHRPGGRRGYLQYPGSGAAGKRGVTVPRRRPGSRPVLPVGFLRQDQEYSGPRPAAGHDFPFPTVGPLG